MQDNTSEELASLRRWCQNKPAVQPSWDGRDGFNVLGEFLGDFIRFYPKENPPSLLLRCPVSVRQSLERTLPNSVRISDKMKWNTTDWHWVDVFLNGTLNQQQLCSLVDDSYQLACDRLEEDKRFQVELIRQKLHSDDVLAKLTEHYSPSHQKTVIDKLSRHAVLLRTVPDDGRSYRAGQTKIGGVPDLPLDFAWPKHASGRPLAFLAQINLSDISKASPLPGVPTSGMFYVFSGYGWKNSRKRSLSLPDSPDDESWTQLQYITDEMGIALQSRQPPADTEPFTSAIVEPTAILSLPHDAGDPDVASLGWSGQELRQLNEIANSYDTVSLHPLGNPARHLLLGHAHIVQTVPEEVQRNRLILLLQIASDKRAGMLWGDGGYLYFWIHPDDLAAWNLSRIFVDFQCS